MCRSDAGGIWSVKSRRGRIVPARCSSQLDQQTSASATLTDAAYRVPAAVADAANRLSASAGHTIRDLVASTSAAAEPPLSFSKVVTQQAEALAAQLDKQIDSITSRAIQLASSNPVTDGLDKVSSRFATSPIDSTHTTIQADSECLMKPTLRYSNLPETTVLVARLST